MNKQDYLDYISLPTKLYNEIEENVADLLVQLNIRSYPVNPMQIALSLGYELVPFCEMNKEAKQILVKKDVDGISHYNPDQKTFVIYYRPDGMKERLRFTIGHEIGHIRMGHRGESELARRIADYYSAYLLAPTPWIYNAGCDDYTDVANTFFVSEPCAMRCFTRYEKWRNIPFIKSYEITLISLLSQKKCGCR